MYSSLCIICLYVNMFTHPALYGCLVKYVHVIITDVLKTTVLYHGRMTISLWTSYALHPTSDKHL